MEITHITQLGWNMRCASPAERDALLAYAATCGIACARPVSADDLGLGWNGAQNMLYLFPAKWAGLPDKNRTYELLTEEQVRALCAAYGREPQPQVVTPPAPFQFTAYDADAAEVLDNGRQQRLSIYSEALGTQDALRVAEKELLDLLPPAALRKLRELQKQARAARMLAYAELVASGAATESQVQVAFDRAYEAQRQSTGFQQRAA